MSEKELSDKEIARAIICNALFNRGDIEACMLAKMVRDDDEWFEAQLKQHIEIFQNALDELKGVKNE